MRSSMSAAAPVPAPAPVASPETPEVKRRVAKIIPITGIVAEHRGMSELDDSVMEHKFLVWRLDDSSL